MKGKISDSVKLEDFKRVYKVFSEPPYNEVYTEEDLERIYNEYNENGYIYGAYNGEECIGLVVIQRGVNQDQPVSYEKNKKIMYLADIAVLNSYRKQGLGNQLMLYAVMQSKSLGYDKIYMRTLEKGSMSCNIAKRIGFREIPNVFQDVECERTDGSIQSMKNIFLDLDLNTLNKGCLKQAINSIIVKENNETSKEEK